MKILTLTLWFKIYTSHLFDNTTLCLVLALDGVYGIRTEFVAFKSVLNLYLLIMWKYLLKSSDDVKIGKRISMFIQNAKLHSLTISYIRMYHIFVSHCISYYMYVLSFIYVWIVLNMCNCTHERTNKIKYLLENKMLVLNIFTSSVDCTVPLLVLELTLVGFSIPL